MTTIQLLDAIRERRNLPSDYAAAALLGLTRSQVSRYRNGKDFMGDEVAQRAAEIIGIDPAVAMAGVHAERASDPQTRRLWVSMAERLERAGVAAAVAALFWGFTGGPDAPAPVSHVASAPAPAQSTGYTLYIMSTARRALRRAARWLSSRASIDSPALILA